MNTTKLSLALTCACALVVTACGGDDGNSETNAGTNETSSSSGDGDGDPATGDGDGDATTTGDGDGDATTTSGDGDGDATGDGDGDTTGDGDGDTTTTGDGDGDMTTTGDGDGDMTSGDGDGDPGPMPCDVPEIDLAVVVPHLMLVLDKSGSMISNSWDHDADPMTADITRWNSLHNVVTFIVNNFDEQFDMGAQLYPSTAATNQYNANSCVTSNPPEVLLGPNNGNAILLGIPTANSNNIRGGTPASSGMASALAHLADEDDGDPAAIILVTDGAANCWPDAQSNSELFELYDPSLLPIVQNAWDNDNIPTYVVGIDIADELSPIGANGQPDNINPTVQLNELAVAGGKPLGGMTDFYQTQNEIELQDAIQTIVDDATSCTVILDPPPPFPDLVEVVIDDMNVPQVMDCENEDGWVYTNPNGPYDSLELCGSVCDNIVNVNSFVAEYYCDAG